MICQFCKHETNGVMGPKTGATLDICKACYYPAQLARCECGRIKNKKSARCSVCHEILIVKGRIGKYEQVLRGLKERLDHLNEIPKCE